MPLPLREEPQTERARHTYPQLDPATLSVVNEKLIEVVSLLSPRALSDEQLRELVASIAVQTKNTERLHSFALSNADDPAFAVRLSAGVP